MQVGEIMTHAVISVREDTTIAEAAGLMLQHHISGLPVCDSEGALVGIVTEGDLLRRAETGTEKKHGRWLEFLLGPGRLAEEYSDAHARKVGEVMTQDVATIDVHQPVTEIVRLMEKHRVKRLPVIERGKLVGIVSRANLVQALVGALVRETPRPANDNEIYDRITAELKKQPWGPRFSVVVHVKDGIVALGGTITDERERTALVVLAENMPGVKAVQDNLVWVDPTTGITVPA